MPFSGRNSQQPIWVFIPVVLEDAAGERSAVKAFTGAAVCCDCTPGVQESSHAWDCTNGEGKPCAPGEGDVPNQPRMQEVPHRWGTGGAGGPPSWCSQWDVTSVKLFLGSFMLPLGTIYGFRELRAWQLHVSWDSCAGKLFPFTLLGLQAGPDLALMKTIPRKSSAFFWVAHGCAVFLAESGR